MADNLATILMDNNNNDKKQVHRGRFLDICFGIDVDRQGYVIKVEKGRITSVLPPERAVDKPVFTFSADSKAWGIFSQPFPPPGYQDVMAMVECGHAKLTGDVFPVLVNLFFVKGIVNGIRMRKAA